MRQLRSDRRGLSEIVGTLFLVLIVVAAATAFAAFVAGYQKTLQNEQAVTQQRSLESIKILHLVPILNSTSRTTWAWLNFTVASLDVNPTIVTEVLVNDHAVRNYTVTALNLSTGSVQTSRILPGGTLSLYPRESFNLNVSTLYGLNNSGLFDYNTTISASSYLKVDLFTYYSNDFKGLFIPPTAIGVVNYLQTYNGSTLVNIPVLDGSGSFQPGNASLLAWTWTVTPTSSSGNPWTMHGEKSEVTNLTIGTTYSIALTVLNSDGISGLMNPDLSFQYTG